MLFQDPGAKVAAKHRLKRSPNWRKAEKAHLKIQPWCVACSPQRKGFIAAILRPWKGIRVHHIWPFHLVYMIGRPDLEFDQRNLLTLCDDHHFLLGHLGSWASFNPHVKHLCIRFFGKSHQHIQADTEWLRFQSERSKDLASMTEDEKAEIRVKLDTKMPIVTN